MNFKIFFVLTICCLEQMGWFVEGAMAVYPADPKRHPGGCYSELTGHMSAKQVDQLKGQCKSATCEPSGEITIMSCGTVLVEGALCLQDYSEPYPKCCSCKNGPIKVVHL